MALRFPRVGARWGDADDATLRRGWASALEFLTLCARLGREPDAVSDRMAELGLSRVPDGWVTLDDGAIIAGMNRRTLVKVLDRQGVATSRSYPAREGARGGRSVIVQRVELVEAVARDTGEVETINAGATARGVRPEVLARWLVALGHHVITPGRTVPVRFGSDVLDSAVRWGRAIRSRR